MTDTSATLSWNSDSIYLGYTVCKYNLLTQDWEFFASTTDTSFVATDLLADTEYRFCVKAANTDEMLGAVGFTTLAKQVYISIDDVSSSAIEMTFENVDDWAHVELYRSENNVDFEIINNLRFSRHYTDKNVEQGKTYYYRARCYVNHHGQQVDSQYSPVVEARTLISMGLPKVSGKTKTFAYYTAVTVRNSPQYKLLNSPECYTDPETGIRMVDGCYCVALGSYYGSKIGTKYKITVSSGNSFNVILCDQKANRHTDKNNQYATRSNDFVEFYVEKGKVPASVRGSYDRLEQFRGRIVSIEKYV